MWRRVPAGPEASAQVSKRARPWGNRPRRWARFFVSDRKERRRVTVGGRESSRHTPCAVRLMRRVWRRAGRLQRSDPRGTSADGTRRVPATALNVARKNRRCCHVRTYNENQMKPPGKNKTLAAFGLTAAKGRRTGSPGGKAASHGPNASLARQGTYDDAGRFFPAQRMHRNKSAARQREARYSLPPSDLQRKLRLPAAATPPGNNAAARPTHH